MDIGQPIAYNGLTCQPLTLTPGSSLLSGCVIDSVDPSQIPVDLYVSKRALADGATVGDPYLSARVFTITGTIFGTSAADLWDHIDDWMAAFSPRSPSLTDTTAFKFYQATGETSAGWPAGYIPLYMTAKPRTQPWYRPVDKRDFAPGAHVMGVGAQLIAPDPLKYINEARIEQALTTTAAAVSYLGNAPAKNGVELWVYLSGTGPVITVTITPTVAGIGSSTINLDLSSLSTGHKWVYSFADRTMIYGGVAAAAGATGNIIGAITLGATASYAIVSGTPGNLTYCKLVYPKGAFL